MPNIVYHIILYNQSCLPHDFRVINMFTAGFCVHTSISLLPLLIAAKQRSAIALQSPISICIAHKLLRQDCDASLTTSLAAQWRAFPRHLIMARLRLLHVFKWRNCKRGGSVSNRVVVCLNVCCGQLDGGEIGF